MRCPKCSTAFVVEKPAHAEAKASDLRETPELPAGPQKMPPPPRAPGEKPLIARAPVAPGPSVERPSPPRPTSALKTAGAAAPLRPAPPGRPAPPRPARVEPPVAETASPRAVEAQAGEAGSSNSDADWLPAVAAGSPAAADKAKQTEEVDLPATVETIDLPQTKPTQVLPRNAASLPSTASIGPLFTPLGDADLPAPAAAKKAGGDAPRTDQGSRASIDVDLPALPSGAGYDSDSELPAALGSRPLASRTNAGRVPAVTRESMISCIFPI